MTKIFVSYSRRRDSDIAKQIAHALEEVRPVGIETFLDSKDLQPGENWRKNVEAAIRSSDAALFVVSPDTVSHSWTGYEIGMAEALGKPLIVLTCDRYPQSELPEDFASLPIVVFDSGKPERTAREIVDRLSSEPRKLLPKEADSP